MKIGIKKKKSAKKGKIQTTMKKKFQNRLKLPTTIRLVMLAVIGLLLLYSLVNVYTAYQQPETTTNSIPTLSYSQRGTYDYGAYLKPNIIYPHIQYLRAGQGIFFKNIIENITTSFSYTFTIDKTAEISGDYSIFAVIETSLWRKELDLPIENASGSFQSQGRRTEFSIDPFVIDVDYYEDIIKQIETETGVTVSQPTLHINCAITVFAQTPDKNIYKTFNPTLSLSLKTTQIEIIEPETNRQSFVETEQQIIHHPEAKEQQNQWTYLSYIVIGIFVISAVFTQNATLPLSKTDKKIKKINKKYGESIVELEKQPKPVHQSSLIVLKTLEDMIKTSEELTKPVLHFKSKDDQHFYYVIDDSTLYQYQLQDKDE